MLNAVASEEVPLSADAVWKVIGDFDDIRKWAPAVMATKSEQGPDGKFRVLSMPPDGRQVKELLVKQEKYLYTYAVIAPDKNPGNNSSTVCVVPIDAGNSRIELSTSFLTLPNMTDEESVAARTKFVRGNLKAMKKALGLA